MIKLMGEKIITILRSKFLLNWAYDHNLISWPICLVMEAKLSLLLIFGVFRWMCFLTLNSMPTPFDAYEISCIGKYYGKCSICSFGANAPFSIIFLKVFKT